MKKDQTSIFGDVVRRFTSHGGTVIMLAHTNKHRGPDGKLIYSGTSDLMDDADGSYSLDIVNEDPSTHIRTVVFESLKARGDVALEATYRYNYDNGISYLARLESIEEVTAEDRKADLGQVGDKVTAASSATAEAVAEQEGEKAGDGADAAADDVVEDAAHEPDFEVEDEHGAIPSGDDSGDSDDDSPHEDTGRADLSAEELRAKRQAAIADEYTDVE